MQSFSIENRFRRKVSCDQFKTIAENLEIMLKTDRLLKKLPTINSELLLTTNEKEYHEARGTRTSSVKNDNIITE